MRRGLGTMILGVWAVLSGCSTTSGLEEGGCISSSECGGGRLCRAGRCTLECLLPSDCDGGSCEFNRCVAPRVGSDLGVADATLPDATPVDAAARDAAARDAGARDAAPADASPADARAPDAQAADAQARDGLAADR